MAFKKKIKLPLCECAKTQASHHVLHCSEFLADIVSDLLLSQTKHYFVLVLPAYIIYTVSGKKTDPHLLKFDIYIYLSLIHI